MRNSGWRSNHRSSSERRLESCQSASLLQIACSKPRRLKNGSGVLGVCPVSGRGARLDLCRVGVSMPLKPCRQEGTRCPRCLKCGSSSPPCSSTHAITPTRSPAPMQPSGWPGAWRRPNGGEGFSGESTWCGYPWRMWTARPPLKNCCPPEGTTCSTQPGTTPSAPSFTVITSKTPRASRRQQPKPGCGTGGCPRSWSTITACRATSGISPFRATLPFSSGNSGSPATSSMSASPSSTTKATRITPRRSDWPTSCAVP